MASAAFSSAAALAAAAAAASRRAVQTCASAWRQFAWLTLAYTYCAQEGHDAFGALVFTTRCTRSTDKTMHSNLSDELLLLLYRGRLHLQELRLR